MWLPKSGRKCKCITFSSIAFKYSFIHSEMIQQLCIAFSCCYFKQQTQSAHIIWNANPTQQNASNLKTWAPNVTSQPMIEHVHVHVDLLVWVRLFFQCYSLDLICLVACRYHDSFLSLNSGMNCFRRSWMCVCVCNITAHQHNSSPPRPRPRPQPHALITRWSFAHVGSIYRFTFTYARFLCFRLMIVVFFFFQLLRHHWLTSKCKIYQGVLVSIGFAMLCCAVVILLLFRFVVFFLLLSFFLSFFFCITFLVFKDNGEFERYEKLMCA